ncbi:MAG: peptide-methionine (S)-S-oxide reductase MsrA [Coxiellaceae bacterium]|nr:peptide-methionine (S)-S-oxide reductase MsrA [Coxiellaceae bacterium]
MNAILIFCCSLLLSQIAFSATKTAIFAGGCFWCMQPPFDKLPGVTKTVAGYAGGIIANPTYALVSSGKTKYLEAVLVEYDPDKIHYQALLDVFWRNVDPLDGGGQFCDRGAQYTSAIFVNDEEQKKLAVTSLASLPWKNIKTQIRPVTTFYPAEEYHQNYYQKNPIRYKYYRYNCGRDGRLKVLWQ